MSLVIVKLLIGIARSSKAISTNSAHSVTVKLSAISQLG